MLGPEARAFGDRDLDAGAHLVGLRPANQDSDALGHHHHLIELSKDAPIQTGLTHVCAP